MGEFLYAKVTGQTIVNTAKLHKKYARKATPKLGKEFILVQVDNKIYLCFSDGSYLIWKFFGFTDIQRNKGWSFPLSMLLKLRGALDPVKFYFKEHYLMDDVLVIDDGVVEVVEKGKEIEQSQYDTIRKFVTYKMEHNDFLVSIEPSFDLLEWFKVSRKGKWKENVVVKFKKDKVKFRFGDTPFYHFCEANYNGNVDTNLSLRLIKLANEYRVYIFWYKPYKCFPSPLVNYSYGLVLMPLNIA